MWPFSGLFSSSRYTISSALLSGCGFSRNDSPTRSFHALGLVSYGWHASRMSSMVFTSVFSERFFFGFAAGSAAEGAEEAAAAAPPLPRAVLRFVALVEAARDGEAEDLVGVAVALAPAPPPPAAVAATPSGALRAACVAARGTDIL